jgi:hypothetical protein
MGSPDLRCVLKFARPAFEHFAEADEPVLDKARRLANLQGLRRVHDVVRGQAVMQPARGVGIANGFADGHGERDHVMLHLGFKLRDSLYHARINARLFANYRCSGGGHDSRLSQRFRCGQLHFQPAAEFALLAPEPAHLFARVS